MNDFTPELRRDLEFFPARHQGQQLILIRDQLGLVQEGKAVAALLYRFMVLLNGDRTIRDLQVELMRQKGGSLVDTDEVKKLLAYLDESYLLDSGRFKEARDKIVADFASGKVRPCSHCGAAYPDDPLKLKERLDEILNRQSSGPDPEGMVTALVSPHIDLSVGDQVYSRAYQVIKNRAPSRIVLLGAGHQMAGDLFCLTDKDFQTPLGTIKNEQFQINKLREAGGDIIAHNDFAHRSEHSIEFQLIFLQHLLSGTPFTIIPILCGSMAALSEYKRDAFIDRAGSFLNELSLLLRDQEQETLLVAGVDLSHTGPKFGHEVPALYLQGQSETHDRNLLDGLSRMDAVHFWEESIRVKDQFNVCGFSALACLLEILPPSMGEILDYQIWHEEATRSAVSFAAVAFTSVLIEP